MIELRIDPELQAFITPLSTEEYHNLEADILANGCLEPLVVWNGVIVDGHHRYEICRRHDLDFKVREESFSSKTEAMLKNEDYLGTDYYPPLITAEVFYAAQKEHEKRTHKGTSLPAQPVPVKSAFILAPLPDKTEQRRAAETVALLYSMITPSESGKATATGAETAAIKAWAEKRITSIPPKSTGDDERSTKCQ